MPAVYIRTSKVGDGKTPLDLKEELQFMVLPSTNGEALNWFAWVAMPIKTGFSECRLGIQREIYIAEIKFNENVYVMPT